MVSMIAFAPEVAIADKSDGQAFMNHIRCAAYAELSVPPLKRVRDDVVDGAYETAVHRHMKRAITLGVSVMNSDERVFPGMVQPKKLGGSAEAGIGAYWNDFVIVKDKEYALGHVSLGDFVAAQDIARPDIDGRFEAMSEWYSRRRTYFRSTYKHVSCGDLLEPEQSQ